jgi:hypothetical protein
LDISSLFTFVFAADERGLAVLLQDLKAAAGAGGPVSEPAPLLVQLAREGGIFADWQKQKAQGHRYDGRH